MAAPAGALIRLREGQSIGDEGRLVLVPGPRGPWRGPPGPQGDDKQLNMTRGIKIAGMKLDVHLLKIWHENRLNR